jgi:hypothetical protein
MNENTIPHSNIRTSSAIQGILSVLSVFDWQAAELLLLAIWLQLVTLLRSYLLKVRKRILLYSVE